MLIIKDTKGNEYKLAFNRKTIMNMEASGFELNLEKPYTCVDSLFYGAFQMYHKKMDREKIREIWDMQYPKDKLLTALVKEYQKPIEELMSEPEDADEENPTWKEV